ncbi:unnamed protein product [Effrenium voratum]|nr:unnamed protein product [Effrenium voratum]
MGLKLGAAGVLEPLLGQKEGLPVLLQAARQVADGKQQALLARALAGSCVYSPELCERLLQGSLDWRQKWVTCEDPELQLEALRFIRMSCEVGGRGAAAWWLAEVQTAPFLRRAVLLALGEDQMERSIQRLLCAVEGVRIWLAWLRCGAGCERLESYAAKVGAYWHRVALLDLPGELGEGHFLLAVGRSGIQTASRHFLELTLEVLRLREVEFQDPEPSFLLDCDEHREQGLPVQMAH